jgi:hypothetical protein
MKAKREEIIDSPELETENVFAKLLQMPNSRKDPIVEALEARDSKALRARVDSLEQQNRELLRRMEAVEIQLKMKADAEQQANAFQPSRHGEPWGRSEVRYLIEIWENTAASIAEVAKKLQRSERAIQMMLDKMGYVVEDNVNIRRESELRPSIRRRRHEYC